MRLFIALELDAINAYLDSLRDGLRQKGLSLTKDAHLTLKFLGDVNNPEQIKDALSKVSFQPFSLTTKDIGFFPNESNPRVVWLGIKQNDILMRLQHDIEQALEGFNPGKDHTFHPHITLARVKSLDDREGFLQKVKQLKVEGRKVDVDHFALIQSDLTPEGPVYRHVGRYS